MSWYSIHKEDAASIVFTFGDISGALACLPELMKKCAGKCGEFIFLESGFAESDPLPQSGFIGFSERGDRDAITNFIVTLTMLGNRGGVSFHTPLINEWKAVTDSVIAEHPFHAQNCFCCKGTMRH
jgi:hypothetical protein